MKISLIIPTLNRATMLARTLLSIERQITDTDFEVIVVDNGSTDSTKKVCESFNESVKNLIYFYDDEPGLLTGRHKGIELSTGKILCFLDDDVELNDKYIQGVFDVFSTDAEVHFATGPCLPEYEVTPPYWLDYFWVYINQGKYCFWLSLLDLGDQKLIIDPNLVFGLNFCVRKETALQLNGFHPDCIPDSLQKYQGDGETGLTMKAVENNLKAVYSPYLSLKHLVSKGRLTIEYFKKRAFYEGVSNSFTDLRISFTQNTVNKSLFQVLKDKIWPYYYLLKISLKSIKSKAIPKEVKEMKKLLDIQNKAGYNFHQNEFKNDEQIRKWVLRSSFWDYKLPPL